MTSRLRYGIPALDETDQNHDHRDYQQYVNKSAEGVGADHSQQPQDQEQGNDGPKHRTHPFLADRSRKLARCFKTTQQRKYGESSEFRSWTCDRLYGETLSVRMRRVRELQESEHLNDPVADRVAGQVGHGMQIQLSHEVGAVSFGCLDAEIECHRDLLAGFSFRQQLNDFPLTRGQ